MFAKVSVRDTIGPAGNIKVGLRIVLHPGCSTDATDHVVACLLNTRRASLPELNINHCGPELLSRRPMAVSIETKRPEAYLAQKSSSYGT